MNRRNSRLIGSAVTGAPPAQPVVRPRDANRSPVLLIQWPPHWLCGGHWISGTGSGSRCYRHHNRLSRWCSCRPADPMRRLFRRFTTRPRAVVLGHYWSWFGPRTLSLSPGELAAHAHVIGRTGSGKSYFLAGLFLDMHRAGMAATLIDPHGDLAALVLRQLVASGALAEPTIGSAWSTWTCAGPRRPAGFCRSMCSPSPTPITRWPS